MMCQINDNYCTKCKNIEVPADQIKQNAKTMSCFSARSFIVQYFRNESRSSRHWRAQEGNIIGSFV